MSDTQREHFVTSSCKWGRGRKLIISSKHGKKNSKGKAETFSPWLDQATVRCYCFNALAFFNIILCLKKNNVKLRAFFCDLLPDYFPKAWLQNRIHEKSCDKCILNVTSYISRPGHLLCSRSHPIIAAQGGKSLILYTGLPSVFFCSRGIWGRIAQENNPLKIICWEGRRMLEPLLRI